MKENNKTKYLLGASLLGIWGLLGFRFYEKMNGDHQPFVLPTEIYKSVPVEHSEYKLSENYVDPFLGKLKVSPKIVRSASPTSTRQISIVNTRLKKVKFPEIQYKGNIVDQVGNVKAIVNIEKEFLNLGLNQLHNGIEIAKIFNDSIVVKKDGTLRTIERLRL